MMGLPRVRHPLDDVLSMLGDIHFDTAAHADASRPLRCLIHKRERMLQPRIARRVRHTFDEESLFLCGYRRDGLNGVHRPSGRRQPLQEFADDHFQRSHR